MSHTYKLAEQLKCNFLYKCHQKRVILETKNRYINLKLGLAMIKCVLKIEDCHDQYQIEFKILKPIPCTNNITKIH
jgi:hypothetical protein